MSTLTADPGFARGQVLGVTKTYYDAQVGDGSHLLGVHKVFADTHPTTGQILSNETVECIAVKNLSGGVLAAKTLVQFDDDYVLTAVDAGATTSSKRFGVVDEYISSNGVPANEVFWLVVKGPTTVLKLTHATDEAIAAGAVVSATATAGKVESGTTLKVGQCITAAASTDTDVRVLANTGA
jgi:hypothetical protein